MKRCWIILAMLLAVAPFARADEASKRAKVQELFVAMKMDALMNQMMTSMAAQMETMFGGMSTQDVTPEQKKIINDYRDRAFKLVMGSMGWKAIEPDYVDIYVKTYTEDEVDGILAFYKSPAGQAMLAKTPELMTQSTALSQQKMKALQPQLKAMIEDMIKQMSKEPPPTPKPATKTPAKS